MSGDLRVTTAHLRELSARRRHAAGAFITATDVVTGVDSLKVRTDCLGHVAEQTR